MNWEKDVSLVKGEEILGVSWTGKTGQQGCDPNPGAIGLFL